MQNRDKSPHILNASSNLLGLCFIILTSLKYLKVTEKSFVDEAVAIAIIFFMASCVLSFLSIRGNIKSGGKYEGLADYLFLGGLVVLFVMAILILFNILK